MNRTIWLTALLLLSGCNAGNVKEVPVVRSEREYWRQELRESSSSEAIGHLDYSRIGTTSGCADQSSIELHGTGDENTAIELAKIMLVLAPDQLVTSVTTSDKLAYIETRVNCATEWLPTGLYAIFARMQVRTPGEVRWQVISVSEWQH